MAEGSFSGKASSVHAHRDAVYNMDGNSMVVVNLDVGVAKTEARNRSLLLDPV
jgi:hypothetical protein